MRIRKRLSLLFIAGALLPLTAITVMHLTSMRQLGLEIGSYTQTILTENERNFLQKTVEDYGRILQRDKKTLEMIVRTQAREVERSLAGPTPSGRTIHFPQAFGQAGNRLPGSTISYKHLQPNGTYKREPVWVNYDHQVFYLAPGTGRQSASEDLARLSGLFQDLRFVYRLHPDLIYWQQTALESGAMSVYPGHSRFPDGYDPRQQEWYRQAKAEQSMVSMIATEAATGTVTQVAALPVHRPDGSFAGVTAIHVPLTNIFQSLKLPNSWEKHAQTMLAMFERSSQTPNGQLRILVHENMPDTNGWSIERDTHGKAYLCSEDSASFRQLLQDASLGYSGVQQICYKGKEMLYAYGTHETGEPFPVIILPYKQVLGKAAEMRSLVEEMTTSWLKLTALAFVGAITLSVILALFSARTVIRPVMRLAGAANGLAKGNFRARARISSGDELEELGDIFNTMGPRLQENESMRHAMAVAKQTQQYLLPKRAPRLEHYDISGISVYSDETGGDYYDYIEIANAGRDKLGIAVGDVSGHGIGAALLMASARGVIRSHATRFSANLDTLFEMLNKHLLQDTGDSQFLTLFYGVLDASQNTLIWSSAGHDPGLWMKKRSGEIHELPNTGMPLGISEDAAYEQAGPITLEAGDLILVGTDGIRETRNPNREMFGEERLHRILQAYSHETTRQICDRIVQSLQSFRQGSTQEDDITLVAIKYQPDMD
jgi:sigma-B regulation protein RsbU (phosphoserine phosphatase)